MQAEFQLHSPSSVVVRGIKHRGVAIVRNTRPPLDWAGIFVDRLEEIGRGERDGAPFVTHYVIGASSIDLIGPEVREWFMGSPLAEIARVYFEDEVFVDQQFSRARIARPPEKALHGSHGFHQDAVAVAYGGEDMRLRPDMLTFWVSLTPAGVTAPGIEYVPIPQQDRIELKPGGHWADPTDEGDAGLQAALKLFGAENFEHPAFDAGDCLILHCNTFHRTYATKVMTEQRVSLDIRVRAVGTG